MKYSSPLIPDGSITTVKIAAGAVTRSKLDTSEMGQAGVITTLSTAVISLDAYDFFPDFATDMPVSASVHLNIASTFDATPTADATAPRCIVHNEDSVTRNYAVEWKKLNA